MNKHPMCPQDIHSRNMKDKGFCINCSSISDATAKKNKYGQTVNADGHVLTTTELHRKAMEPILEAFRKQCLKQGQGNGFEQTLHELAKYVTHHDYKDWYDGYRQGYQAAKDGKEL